jgi:phosphatidylglycerol---prolipoprotein diacylglyceryl transferase
MRWTDSIDPTAFTIGALPVRWYALSWAAGYAAMWVYLRARARRGVLPLDVAAVEGAMAASVVAIAIGGRLGAALFYYPGYFVAHPLELPLLWKGGMSAHGAMIALFLLAYLIARRHRTTMLAISDVFVVPLSLAQTLGRLGNFANGELYGAPTSVPWGVVFPVAGDDLPRHPAQLYEALYDLVLWIFLFRVRDAPLAEGVRTGIWAIGYGLARLGVDALRDAPSALGPFSTAQLLTLPMPLVGLWLVVRGRPRPSGPDPSRRARAASAPAPRGGASGAPRPRSGGSARA